MLFFCVQVPSLLATSKLLFDLEVKTYELNIRQIIFFSCPQLSDVEMTNFADLIFKIFLHKFIIKPIMNLVLLDRDIIEKTFPVL